MKMKQFAFIILAVLFVISGCGDGKTTLEITQAELDTEVNRVLVEYESQGQPIPESDIDYVSQQLLEVIINQRILFNAAEAQGFLADDAEVDAAIQESKDQLESEEAFTEKLAAMDMTEDDLRKLIFEGKSIEKLIEDIEAKEVTDGDINDFYTANPQYFEEAEQIRASHILVSVDPESSEEDKAAAFDKINALAGKLKEGSDFAELAKEHSSCPSSSKGGDLDFFSKGQMVPPFEDAAFALEVNGISDVVETQFGYHLIKLTDKKEAGTTPLEEVSADIKNYLDNSKIETFITKEKEKYTIVTPGFNQDADADHVHDENCDHE